MRKTPIPVVLICLITFTYTFIALYAVNTIVGNTVSSSSQLGAYTTFYYLGYLISQLPGGILADKYSAKKLLMTCITICAITIILLGFAGTNAIGLLLRVLCGISCGPIMACTSRLIAKTFEDTRTRAEALGIMLAGPPLGLVIANSFTPFLLSNYSYTKSLFYLGLLALPIVLLAFIILPSQDKTQNSSINIKVAFSNFITSKQQLVLAFSGSFFMFVVVGYGIWGRRYFMSERFSPTEINMTMTLFSIFAVLGSCSSGYLAKWLNWSHKRMMLTVFPLLGLCFFILPLIPRNNIIIFSGVFGFIAYLPSAHYIALATELESEGYTAIATSLQNFFLQIGAFIMPSITSAVIIKFESFTVLWIFFSAFTVISEVLVLIALGKPHVETSH